MARLLDKINPFKGLTIGKLFTFVIALLILTQVFSLLISSIFTTIPALKTGSLLIILSAGMTLIFLATIVFSGDFSNRDIIGLVLVGAITVLMYIYGSEFFPQIFSFIDSSAVESAQSLASFIGLP